MALHTDPNFLLDILQYAPITIAMYDYTHVEKMIRDMILLHAITILLKLVDKLGAIQYMHSELIDVAYDELKADKAFVSIFPLGQRSIVRKMINKCTKSEPSSLMLLVSKIREFNMSKPAATV